MGSSIPFSVFAWPGGGSDDQIGSILSDATDRPVFIGACPRSGTTLLRSMLDAHPALALPRETRFLLETWERRRDFGDLTVPRNKRRLVEWIVKRKKKTQFGRLELEDDEAIQRLVEAPPTIGSVLGTCFAMYSAAQGASRWGDKRPKYVQHTSAMYDMFPDMCFIEIVRDPRACVASMKKLGWFGGAAAGGLELWNHSVTRGLRAQERYGPRRLMTIRYEDLVQDPEPVLTRICEFADLDTRHLAGMLAFHRDTDIPENRYHWRVSEPISQAPISSWQEGLDDAEVALIESQARGLMEKYGYEPSLEDPKPPRTLVVDLFKRKLVRLKDELASLHLPYRQPTAARLTSAQRELAALD